MNWVFSPLNDIIAKIGSPISEGIHNVSSKVAFKVEDLTYLAGDKLRDYGGILAQYAGNSLGEISRGIFEQMQGVFDQLVGNKIRDWWGGNKALIKQYSRHIMIGTALALGIGLSVKYFPHIRGAKNAHRIDGIEEKLGQWERSLPTLTHSGLLNP